MKPYTIKKVTMPNGAERFQIFCAVDNDEPYHYETCSVEAIAKDVCELLNWARFSRLRQEENGVDSQIMFRKDYES
jgi:hypothetical protein